MNHAPIIVPANSTPQPEVQCGSPGELATLIEFQAQKATSDTQKITMTFTVRDAMQLASLLRQAGMVVGR